MDKTDKKVCAVSGISFIFSVTYGLEAFIMGAIAGFIITLAADIVFFTAASVIKRVKRSRTPSPRSGISAEHLTNK